MTPALREEGGTFKSRHSKQPFADVINGSPLTENQFYGKSYFYTLASGFRGQKNDGPEERHRPQGGDLGLGRSGDHGDVL